MEHLLSESCMRYLCVMPPLIVFVGPVAEEYFVTRGDVDYHVYFATSASRLAPKRC